MSCDRGRPCSLSTAAGCQVECQSLPSREMTGQDQPTIAIVLQHTTCPFRTTAIPSSPAQNPKCDWTVENSHNSSALARLSLNSSHSLATSAHSAGDPK